ncbi:conserved hypothetical protein [Anaeromyxobacter sp. K]|uniref:hypothetical protein n=1 Tax=Anaeromyxobacter sp. (strain K) TaxID=447217 RepID=UPI00015F8ABE|nr:hypothetical protein [Anaeromyxobacter sp. K]ACG72958.1 conserved hypothetical protein [Anaeromyxobacter sp. K]
MTAPLISPTIHGILDYLLGAVLVLAPSVLGLPAGPAVIAYAVGGAHLAMSLLTGYAPGALRVIPFWAHGAVEAAGWAGLLVFLGLLTAPADGLFLASGVGILIVSALTDYGVEADGVRLRARRHAHARP